MKKLIPVLLMLFAFTNVNAQKTRLRELQQQLATHPQQDTFRINRLTDLALLGESSTAGRDAAANEALLLSRQLAYKEGEARALMAQAYTKNNVQAIDLLEQALAIAEERENKTLISQISSSLGGRLASTPKKDLALQYLMNGVAAARATNDKIRLARAQRSVSNFYAIFKIDYVKALGWGLQALHTAEQSNDVEALAGAWSTMADVYLESGDNVTALTYTEKALEANKKLGNTRQVHLLMTKGELYAQSKNYGEALRAYKAALEMTDDFETQELGEIAQADIYEQMGEHATAKQYAFSALDRNKRSKRLGFISMEYNTLARVSLHTGKPDSALYYGHLGYDAAVKLGYILSKRDNAQVLADAYAQKKLFDKAYTFQNLYISYRDSITNSDVKNKASLLKYNADLQQKQAEIRVLNKDKQLQKAEAQRQYYLLIGALAAILFIAALVLVLYRNNHNKQKANTVLQKQKEEIQHQRDQTNAALTELKSTQAQLIQSEKMASLGELTAGIAHEIQNPLNFVNNFSEVNAELIEELKSEKSKVKSERDDHLEEELLNDIAANEQKINHHGRRADAIVKGMLQHSRASGSKKEPTDINALADEYLRLSYQGLRAKDKNFNAKIETDFDESIGKIEVVPQDIGRVLLNLFNNAFYAVKPPNPLKGEDYQPRVVVSTKKEGDKVVIFVRDNGTGIPHKVVDKIFQPFFTTKPTGQGTGLGLSLSYDIIKAHGGEIKVESKEGEGTEFIIRLPLIVKSIK